MISPSILRQNAEDLLQMKQSGKYLHLLETNALKLIHELEVQQKEFEMQNQELILARAQEVIASEKYYELYDNAPMVDISDQKLAADSLRFAEKKLQAEVMQRAQQLESLNKALYKELVKYKASQKQLKKSLKDFKKIFTYVQKVREEERINIARIIHDDLAQLLTTLKIELTSHKRKIDDPELRMHHSIDSMLNLVDNCITSVTSVITELRPVILDEMDLIPSLKQLFSDFQNHTGITSDIRVLEDSFPVKDETATAVYRVVQEALINIHNHSKATYLSVILTCNPSFLSIILKDNGRGITPEESSDPRSFGIIGMKERIEEMNGKITFKGIPGKGTTVKLKVPVKKPD